MIEKGFNLVTVGSDHRSISMGAKLIIDKVEYCFHGFRFDTENGTVLAITPNIVVKTPNGALEIKKYRRKLKIEIGDILI